MSTEIMVVGREGGNAQVGAGLQVDVPRERGARLLRELLDLQVVYVCQIWSHEPSWQDVQQRQTAGQL